MEEVDNSEVIYEFGRFVLDPKERFLLFDDQPVHLRPKEFETLLLLLENNGRAISKEEMISALWQEAFVDEGNLTKQISRLRRVFNGDSTAFIETLPKHGYRFSADVNRILRPVERTVRSDTFPFENSIEDALSPFARVAPWRNGRQGIYIFAALVLIGGTAAGLVRFWQKQYRTAKADESGIVFLTDGSQDDSGARLTNGGQIYFSRYIHNTRLETWVMNADGTNQRRANAEIKNLLTGNWSPDGNKVVFRKEGDKTIYLADATGANEIALPILGGNMDWSPDGSQFVHQARWSREKSEIFLYKLATGENVKLTDDVSAADPSFSYDGKQIAFTSWRDGNPEIYVINTDGSNARRLTDHPAFDQYPVFSPDGTAVAFQSNREDERIEVYLQNLNVDTPPERITNSDSHTGISPRGWSLDGTRILLYTNHNGKNRICWANVEPSPPKVVLSDERADIHFPRFAPDGRQILSQARLSDRSIELRLTDLESERTETVFKTGPDHPQDSFAPAFSPKSARIAFNHRVNGNSEIFVINADGSTLQNLTNHPLPDTYPVFSPDGSEIIFTRDFYGKSKLYRMNLYGSSQRRLSEMEGFEINGGFSPDGSTFAFAADRQTAESRGLDIFLLDFKNPRDEVRLTTQRSHEVAPAFSPDGNRVVFASNADGNWEIYVINRDGSGLFRLTRNGAEDTSPQWSLDGKKIIFSSNREGRFAIYEIEVGAS